MANAPNDWLQSPEYKQAWIRWTEQEEYYGSYQDFEKSRIFADARYSYRQRINGDQQ